MGPIARVVNPLYLITFILAFCSIVYELLMAQTLTVLTGDSVLRYSTTIGLYLASMGIGAFICSGKLMARPVKTLLTVEILLSIVGGAAVLLLHFTHAIYSYLLMGDQSEFIRLTFFFTVSYGIIAIIGVLTGFELPLLIHIREEEQEKTANLVLGVDYLGSLAGAILFPLILLPHLGVLNVGFVTAMLNVLAALTLLSYKGIGVKRMSAIFSVSNVTVLCAIILALSFSSDINQYCLKKYYYYMESGSDAKMLFSDMKVYPEVERFRSPYQNIDIVRNPDAEIFYLIFAAYSKKFEEDPEYPDEHWLFLNGDYQFFSAIEEIYHEWMVHIPIIANKVPKRVLVLGGGDGMVNRELLKYKEIKSITQVELDPKMINLSKTHPLMRRFNEDSLYAPRVTVKLMDAFYYLRTTTEKYDAIFIDFPDPKDYNLSKLYSREFYSFVRKRLTSDGFVAIDAPGSMIRSSDNDWLIYYHTIKASGFKTIVPFASVLEEDNPKLFQAFYKAYNLGVEDVNEIPDLVRDLCMGFIMMRKSDESGDMPYKENGIENYVLNEKRYQLAFTLPYPMPKEIDWKMVNSIMRPTLPAMSFFNIRLPY